MTVVSTTKDTAALTLTVLAEFEAPRERVWQLWVDPRQLERWWGPPTWPATFEQHDVVVGGTSRGFFMTGPEGEKARGWFRFRLLDEPNSLEFYEGFSDESGEPSTDMPEMRMRAELVDFDGGTRMTITTHFASSDEMQQCIEMGMDEGMDLAVRQIDGILAAS